MSESKYQPMDRIGVAISSVSENHTTMLPSVALQAQTPDPSIVTTRKMRDASLGVDIPR